MTTIQTWLADFVVEAGGIAGTVHFVAGEVLELAAAYNIPANVQQVTRTIPKGKGMAGLAWLRVKPVQTCNLREDQTGDVRPGAKAVDARGAIALPLADEAGEVFAILGVAFPDERELDDAAVEALGRRAAKLAELR